MEDDGSYRCKRVTDHTGRELVILMQNANGPCPLLGLSNVLLLRGAIHVHPDVPEVSFSELSARLAEHMLDVNRSSDANQRQNINDGMVLFPKLQTGLDVNVRFSSVDAFEFSEDMILFDLLHVRLLHGWLVDPQDRATAAVIGRASPLMNTFSPTESPAKPTNANDIIM